MKVLITGAGGQLGSALLRTAPAHADLNSIDIEDVDFLEVEMLRARLVVEAPEIIINAAAFTDAVAAEDEEGLAHEINAAAVAVLVEAMEGTGGKLVHVSCDCVFDGTATEAYLPNDVVNPISAYGRTKAEGEVHLRPQDLLVRTSWLYEADGDNFVCAMIREMRDRDEIVAASDQISSPTWATGLARTIWALLERQASGIFHHSDEGVVSRHDFAIALAEEALRLGIIDRIPVIRPVASSADQAGTARSVFSPLDCSATRVLLGEDAAHWRENLRMMLTEQARLG